MGEAASSWSLAGQDGTIAVLGLLWLGTFVMSGFVKITTWRKK